MTINKPLMASVKAVGAVMESARDPWWIIASAAVALHGADAGHVDDVDVLLSVDDATRILPSIGIEVRCGSEHPDFRSQVFGAWLEPPLRVEFMAGFSYRSETKWLPVQPRTRELAAIDDVGVFIPDRSELEQILRSIGRPKDLDRAGRLAALNG